MMMCKIGQCDDEEEEDEEQSAPLSLVSGKLLSRFSGRRTASSLRHVQDAGGHQLSGEPVEALVQAHAAAGVAALYVPAPPTAQLVQAQQLRHLLHGHGTRDVLQNKQS